MKGPVERPALCFFEDISSKAVKAAVVRLGIRTILSLCLCAAAMGAALAHFAIDVIGDYALSRDSYDHLQHGSRDVVSGLAVLVAVLLAAHGLRICCEIAAKNRARLLRPALRLREYLGNVAWRASLRASRIVPAMEYFDGRLDGVPVARLADAFGGSIALGIGTTIVCAALVALLVCAFARWLISHRDSIATIIETFLHSFDESVAPSALRTTSSRLSTLPQRRAIHALRLAKRGPPETRFA